MFVLSLEPQSNFVLAGWQRMPMNDADLAANSFPLPIALTLVVGATKMMAQYDAILLFPLDKAGLAVKKGKDGIGPMHR